MEGCIPLASLKRGVLNCILSVCRVGAGFGIPSCAEIQPLGTAQMLVEEVPGCWWSRSWYVGGLFLVVFQEKNFCTESHTIIVSLSVAANISGDIQGGSVRPPDLSTA